MKRLFDVIVSLAVLIIFSPVLIVLALLIKFESPGPIVFRQQRVGLNGEIFHILKLRSMIVDAAKVGPYFTRQDDPRITQIGRFIRKTSLDELPQLFNVLKGEMSLVGPRPDVPEQRKGYTQQEWDKRHSVKPGITGLAQALLRSAATAGERKRLDLQYVDKISFGYDAWIILQTVKQLVMKGSY